MSAAQSVANSPLFGSHWDATRRRCFLLSLGAHILIVALALGWDSLMNWWLEQTPIPAEQKEATPSRVVFAAPAQANPIRPELLPNIAALPQPSANPEQGQALRPRLDQEQREGSGAGSSGGRGDTIELPKMPPAMALPLPKRSDSGGGTEKINLRQRQEQEANYLLMGLILRQYRLHWKPIYGDRLPRRTFLLWIEHDNSRVVRAALADGSSSGIEALDRLILAWLVEDNRIDLSNLRNSQSPLLMTVDLYQAHR